MSRIIRLLAAIVMATALFGIASATEPLAPEAAAASSTTTYVSKKYTAPRQGQSNAGVTALQRRLVKAKALSSGNVTGYFGTKTTAAVKKFQRKVKLKATGVVTRTTWNKLVAKTGTMKIAKRSTKISSRCDTGGVVLCIDKTRDKLYYVKKGKILKTLDARFGCASTRTREGTFRVFRKSRHHVSTIYHTPMPWAMFFSGGQAVHYSADFAARGYNGCSHGCVNIRSRSGIAWVYSRTAIGTKVVVYRS